MFLLFQCDEFTKQNTDGNIQKDMEDSENQVMYASLFCTKYKISVDWAFSLPTKKNTAAFFLYTILGTRSRTRAQIMVQIIWEHFVRILLGMIRKTLKYQSFFPNFLSKCCSSENNSVKYLKIALIGPYLGKNRVSISYTQNQVQFFLSKIPKGDHKLSKTCYCTKL